MEEIQLIDTIFYFVDTMAEYRQILTENKILSRTIVFVDETCEIYKDGKLFGGYDKFIGQLEELAQEVRTAMDQSENEVRELIRNLRDQVLQQFDQEINLINEKVTQYKDRLDALRAEFDQAYIEQGEAVRDIDEINGILSEYASWKSSVTGTLTTFSNTINAQNATLRTFGERLNVTENTVTNYEHLVDLAKQELKEYIENYDITSKTRSIIGREILLSDGLLHDFATITNVDNMVRTSVDTWFSALDPSWSTLVSKINNVEQEVVAMAGFDARIDSLEDGLNGMQASVTMFADWYSENSETLAYLKAAADENSALFDIQAQFDENNGDNELVRSVAARIFGYANSEGSNIVFEADHFHMQGTDFKLNVDYIEGLGTWALGEAVVGKLKAEYGSDNIRIDALLPSNEGVYGIKSSTNGFYFSLDGSGWVANKNIIWDTAGNLTIKGSPINPTSGNPSTSTTKIENVYISDYWSKTEFTPTNYILKTQLGPNGDLSFLSNSNLRDWVISQISNATFGEGTDLVIEQQVQTILQNEISRADGPFDGFVTDEGLLTTLTAKLYDAQGNVIGEGDLGTALSNLKKMSGALIRNNEVIGLVAQADLTTEVTNIINGNSTISGLNTWAQSISGMESSGWSLSAMIHNLCPNVNASDVVAEIVGEVNDSGSSITISADKINFEGDVFINGIASGINNKFRIDFQDNYGGIRLWEPAVGLSYRQAVVNIDGLQVGYYGNSVNSGTSYCQVTPYGIVFHNDHINDTVSIGSTATAGPGENPSITIGDDGWVHLVGVDLDLDLNYIDADMFTDLWEGLISNLTLGSNNEIEGIDLTATNSHVTLSGGESYINVGNNISLSAETSTITTTDLQVNGRSNYEGYAQFQGNARFYGNLISDSQGTLYANGTISISQGCSLLVAGYNGWSGEITISGTKLTFNKGILTGASGSGIDPA